MLRVPAVCSLLALRSGCSWDNAGPLIFFGVPLLPAFLESGDWAIGGCACWGFCGGSLPATQQQDYHSGLQKDVEDCQQGFCGCVLNHQKLLLMSIWARQRWILCTAWRPPARSVLGVFQAAEPGASVPRTLQEALDGQRLWGLAWRAGTRQSSGPLRGLSSLPRISSGITASSACCPCCTDNL